MRKFIIVVSFGLCVAQSVWAQTDERAIEPHVISSPKQTTYTPAEIRGGDGYMVAYCIQPLTTWPTELRDACQALLLSSLRTDQRLVERRLVDATFSSDHLKRTLENQAWQSVFLFWVVIAVTAIGLLAAVIQFYRSLRAVDTGSAEFAVSANEFRIKTTWLGALLLGMSMGFLTLYLLFVYPVQTLLAA